MKTKQETWKPVKGYEGLYMVSNHGRVKSIDRKVRQGKREISIKGNYLTTQITPYGYSRVKLSCKNKSRRIFTHVLVAEAFKGSPEKGIEVNHKDGNKLNNHASNLEWNTRSQNIKHAYDTGLKIAPSGAKHGRTKYVLNLETGIFYESAKEAAESSNYSRAHLIDMLNGKHKNKTSFTYVKST